MSIIRMSSEQNLIRSEVRKFVSAELEPVAADIEKGRAVPASIIAAVGRMGLFGLTVPEVYGGAGLDMVSLCVALEELARSCASLALMVGVNNCLVTQAILGSGQDEARRERAKRLAAGAVVGYAPLSEIDVDGPAWRIEADGDHNYLVGRCDIVLAGMLAESIVVPVRAAEGIGLYLVVPEPPATATYPVQVMGLRSAGTCGVEFKRAPLDASCCLGAGSDGDGVFRGLVEHCRIVYAAIALGIAEASLDAAVKYSKQRRQFGRAICEFPMVREMLAGVKSGVETSRLLVYDAATRVDTGEDRGTISRTACLESCAGAVSAALSAIQIHGGYGYTTDYPVERYFRDAKTLQLLGEAPADLTNGIAEEILI